MRNLLVRRRALALAVTAAAASASIAWAAGGGPNDANAAGGPGGSGGSTGGGGGIHLLAPTSGDLSGIGGKGFFIDLKADLNVPLDRSGFGGQGPAPGAGKDGRNQSLIVLMSTAKAGQGQNLAGLFDVVGVTDRRADKTQIWATWQAAKANFGNGPSTVTVALAGDRNHDGILNDAPDKVADANGDGDVDQSDLQAIGATSIKSVDFTIG